jgi:hypothetical protein
MYSSSLFQNRADRAFLRNSGANYFFYYGTVIFQGTGINNSFVTQMILNGINFGTPLFLPTLTFKSR